MSSSGDGSLKKKIKALIAFRAALVTVLFGSSFFFKGSEQLLQNQYLYYLIGTIYFLTLAYAFLLDTIRNPFLFGYAQLAFDVICATAVIYLTGGIDSWFSFTFLLIIIASSIVLNRKAGFVIATLSSVLYGGLVNLQLYNFLPSGDTTFARDTAHLYKLFLSVFSFYVTAYLSGYLSGRLERTVQELEQTDTDLRNLELFNQEVIESLPSGLFTVDASGKVLLFNQAAERITGLRKESVVGQKIDDAMPYFPFPFAEGRREEIIPVAGDQKIIGITISRLKGLAERPKGFIAVFQDLTQIKKLENEIKQKEKLAAIGELSSNIAHEIRNPLASLKGSIEMLREDTMSPNYKERLMDIALKEMERLNHIITDFLSYSRPTLPVFQTFNVGAMLDETIEMLRHVDHLEGRIAIRKAYGDEILLDADPQKMQQVFWNLGLNAVEAMPEGGELTVSASATNDHVTITFTDTGYGIDRENIGKIFYPFFTTKERGTGLGLAIAYRIIEEHRGKLTVRSDPGIRTSFEIILPAIREKT